MIEIVGLPSHPLAFVLTALAVGFGAAVLIKLYGLFFRRWKTPFRIGETVSASHAQVVEWDDGKGYVSADGELWRATSKDALLPGDRVTVAAVDGLMLRVNRKPA